jgi:hypothetical protein
MVRLEPGQARAVRALARRRQKETGSPQPDVSGTIRELLDEALAARRGR